MALNHSESRTILNPRRMPFGKTNSRFFQAMIRIATHTAAWVPMAWAWLTGII